jgi:hypothetical protein
MLVDHVDGGCARHVSVRESVERVELVLGQMDDWSCGPGRGREWARGMARWLRDPKAGVTVCFKTGSGSDSKVRRSARLRIKQNSSARRDRRSSGHRHQILRRLIRFAGDPIHVAV